MTCLFISLGIALLAVIYGLISVSTLHIHGKGPYDPPFRYFSIGFLAFSGIFLLIGATQLILAMYSSN